jgi:N-acetylmuramoyl-L-alanine amidase
MRTAFATAIAVLSLVAGAAAPPAALGPPLAATPAAVTRPHIVWRPIPFSARRKAEMAAYSFRHYGTRAWELTDPKAIVEHYTAGTSFQGAWNTFAANAPHNGELPGTCAHFVIDRDGTIYQLVPLGTRCRHAVGMNATAIGIEHVGTSDAMVLGDRAQMRASLRLTLWLMQTFHIDIGNVIGHNETLYSPFRHELVPSWQCLVHADFPHWAMHQYRTRLRALARADGVAAGTGPRWANVYGC